MPQSYHIIIAERDATLRALLARLIATLYPTARVSVVADGTTALATYQAQGADLLITGERLVGLRGLELVRTLRAQQARLPILLLSADAGLADMALAAGASAFVPKLGPFAVLRQALIELLSPDAERAV
jgi:two-component system, OmpR family, response regulator